MIIVLSNLKRMEYLDRTISSINESATDKNKLILIDGVHKGTLLNWETISAPKPEGAWRTENKWTTWEAFKLAYKANEDLLFFEDDVIGCKNAVRYSELLKVPEDCAILQLYTPWGTGFPNTIVRYHSQIFTFCQVMKIPLRTLEILVKNEYQLKNFRFGGSDDSIAKILGNLNLFIGLHYPGIFQHIGENSTVSEVFTDRKSPSWVGEDFDAMDLLKWWQRNYV